VISRSIATFLFSAGALLLSCGRSPLAEGDRSGTAGAPGGEDGAAASTGATAGTTGGSSVACVLSGKPITHDPTPEEHTYRPYLVPATEDGERMSVVFSHESVDDPILGFERAAHVTFAPWGSWPEGLGPPLQAAPFFGAPFAAAPASPGKQPGFSALLHRYTNANPTNVYFAPAVDAATDYMEYPEGVWVDSGEPSWPTALARGSPGYLAAYQVEHSPFWHMRLALIDEASLAVSVLDDVSCGDVPLSAGVIPAAGGFLVATATGEPFGACSMIDGGVGPPRSVHVLRVDQAAKTISLAASFEGEEPVAQIATAKRPDGAWLVWREAAASKEPFPPIKAVVLDESGAAVGPVVLLTKEGQTGGPFAAAALGSGLVVAWIEPLDATSATIRLGLFDETGSLVEDELYTTPASWIYEASLSLAMSPDGAQILLAWADGGPDLTSAVRVARFSCASAGL
jgi:hypothetical protein